MTKTIFIILTGLLFVLKLNAQVLIQTNWLLISIENLKTGEYNIVDTRFKASLHFDSDNKYGGYSGCNSFYGYYKLSMDSIIEMDDLTSTEIGCAGPRGLGERLFYSTLNATYYKLKSDSLFLFASDNYRMTFKKQ